MLKILVADKSTEFCRAVENSFAGRYSVTSCEDGRKALELIGALQPDVLWLDLMLPRLDGITILQSITLAGIRPSVIAASSYISEYIQSNLFTLGVCYLLSKPFSISAALARIESVAWRRQHPQMEFSEDPNERIYEMLLMLGVVGKRSGHLCLVEAVRQMVLDPQMQITKVLYPTVASICGGTPERVERALRGVISTAWECRDPYLWKLYFPESTERCPSNGAFIGKLADSVRWRLQEDERRCIKAE